MKKLGITLMIGLIFLQFSCKKTEYVEAGPQLLMTVVEDNVVIVEGATISLYSNEHDYETKSNLVTSLVTDSKGQALFEDLHEQKYFFSVVKGELDNQADIGSTREPLKIGQRSEVLVKIMKTLF